MKSNVFTGQTLIRLAMNLSFSTGLKNLKKNEYQINKWAFFPSKIGALKVLGINNFHKNNFFTGKSFLTEQMTLTEIAFRSRPQASSGRDWREQEDLGHWVDHGICRFNHFT